MRCLAILALLAVTGISFASDPAANLAVLAAETYQRPPTNIEEAVLAPWEDNINGGDVNPQGTLTLVRKSVSLPEINLLAKPHVNLAGIDVVLAGGISRSLVTRPTASFAIMDLSTGALKPVKSQYNLSGGNWSPDGSKIAFLAVDSYGVRIAVYTLATGRTKLVGGAVNTPASRSIQWLGDSRRIVYVAQTAYTATAPPAVATGPVTRVSDTKADSLRTYASLLDTPFDQAFLETVLTGRIAVIDTDANKQVFVGSEAMVTSVNPDPSGTGFIVSQTLKPFSYIQPASSFPRKTTVIDFTGKEVYVISEPRQGQSEEEQRQGGRGQQGQAPTNDKPRGMSWHPFGGKLLYLQMEPEVKPTEGSAPVKRKDQVIEWKAPYGETDKRTLWASETPISSIQVGSDGQTLFVTQTINGKRTVSWVRPSDSPETHKVAEYASDDFLTSPGNLTTTDSPVGGTVVRMAADSQSVFLAGTIYDKDPTKNAPKPFINKVNLSSGATKRVFESPANAYETAQILDQDANRLLVTRQTPKEVPQLHYRDSQSGANIQLTKNQDYLPDITQARRETLTVTRPDGLKFKVRITLPSGSIGRNPAFFWFYPSEFENQAAYDRSDRTLNINQFRTVRATSPDILLREGYAVVDNDCPIVGPSTAPNDYYTHQLRMNLTATIDALDAAGYIDRTKLAIGGHSYGAFSTANALINTTFFKAGIAGDGNYNRSFTPFGFQSEPRQLWQAKSMYEEVSALLNADRMTGALLMYHGMEDQNMGTDPSHSRRMYQALEALGKPSAMYMYPYEDHGQIAKQTRLDLWARWVAWLDRWVKNPEAYEKTPAKEVPPPAYAAVVTSPGHGTKATPQSY